MTLTPSELDRTAVTPPLWLPGYEILGLIGSGGFGDVYRARQLKLDRIVAVKVVDLGRMPDPATAARFENEAVALGRFHHPNIVPVYDYGRHGGKLFLAMELLEGEDLGARLDRVGPLDERTAWLIARQAAAGLAHAAAFGVVHRDVKPANLFLVPALLGAGLPDGVPVVKVTDFGLARVRWAVDPDGGGRRTGPGVSLGTPAYMAPEQHRGDEVDLRADIYALGATVYHMLTGRPPFEGRTVWDVMARKLENTPRTIPGGSRETVALIDAMMAADCSTRIGSYEQLIERIDRLPAVRGSVVPAVATSGRVGGRKAFGVAAALLVAGAGAAAGRGLWLLRGPAEPPAARYVSGGEIVALFDGNSLDRWGVEGGNLSLSKDEENTSVMTLIGSARRPFAPSDAYRLTIGLDPHRAKVVEVHFGIPAADPDGGRRYALRVVRDGEAVLGTRQGEHGEFKPLPRTHPIPVPSADRMEFGNRYLGIQVQLAGGAWDVQFRRQLVGRVADDGVPKLSELRLVAEDGPARFAEVEHEQLRAAD